MQTKLDRTASIILFILCLITIVFSLRFIHNQTKWSPIDEYSHMDYINKLSSGKLPRSSDQISLEMFFHITTDTLRNPQRNMKTYQQLGLAAICYEAIHPPLYYALLTPPNMLMNKMGVKLFYRLKMLRLFSYAFFVIGMFICIPLFKSLNKLGYSIPNSYGLGCTLFGLLLATHQRFGLGNNMLVPLMINSAGIFLINYYHHPEDRTLYRFVLFVLLSIFTGLSTVFILPGLCIIMLLKYRSHFTVKNFAVITSMIIAAALTFMFWKSATIPDKNIDGYLQQFLTLYIPAGFADFKTFYGLWLHDAFTLSFIKNNFDIGVYVLAITGLSIIICIVYFKTLLKKLKWLISAGLLFLTFLIAAFLVNNYVAGVHWVAFRHYLGFIPVMYVMCTAFLLVLIEKYFKNSIE